jgi:hypothetical protein
MDFIIEALETVQEWLNTLGLGAEINDFINGIFDAFYSILGA